MTRLSAVRVLPSWLAAGSSVSSSPPRSKVWRKNSAMGGGIGVRLCRSYTPRRWESRRRRRCCSSRSPGRFPDWHRPRRHPTAGRPRTRSHRMFHPLGYRDRFCSGPDRAIRTRGDTGPRTTSARAKTSPPARRRPQPRRTIPKTAGLPSVRIWRIGRRGATWIAGPKNTPLRRLGVFDDSLTCAAGRPLDLQRRGLPGPQTPIPIPP